MTINAETAKKLHAIYVTTSQIKKSPIKQDIMDVINIAMNDTDNVNGHLKYIIKLAKKLRTYTGYCIGMEAEQAIRLNGEPDFRR